VELLAADEIRKLVWSIGRFVSEDLTRHVDIARTVQATAHAGGMAVMHYQHVIHPREVWLWVDEATQDLAMHRLIWELQYSLGRAGLPCRRACFRELPEPVTWEEGQSFSPLSLEGHRHGALVLLLTSGEGIAMAHDLAPERVALLQLLHALADWPQLAFVDVSHGKFGLAGLLQRYGLRCITPEEVPEFLGAEARDVARHDRVTVPLAGDLKAWAAGLALCPDPVDDTSALALHHAMGLHVEPWAMTVLLEQGAWGGTGIEWSPQQRAAWLNWLVQAEGIADEIPEPSKLGKALDFWHQRYTQKAEGSQEQHSPAAYRFAMERALLDLWRTPEQAALDLYTIYRTEPHILGAEIERRLESLVPRSENTPIQARNADDILLPWRWERLSAKVRGLLYRMGIARRQLTARPLQVPGTMALALGICFGVSTAILVQGGLLGLGLLVAFSIATGMMARRFRQQNLAEETTEPLDMVAISGGTFMMGATAEDDEPTYENERPRHQVTVSDFLIARIPVTRKQYRQVTRQRASQWRWYEVNPRLPATGVSWFDAVRFCNDLSEEQGLQPCYDIAGDQVTWMHDADGYRLPTEAEWEYAARAGTATRWFCGDTPTELGRYAWYSENSKHHLHAVGKKAPNPWGLYDMVGNVWEWCWDWYDEYAPEAVTDPMGPARGVDRVLRGGAFWTEAGLLRSASRDRFGLGPGPGYRLDLIGFRVVRGPRRQHAVS
jgi:formylglycine-generating enzyme required for sulfatase activity